MSKNSLWQYLKVSTKHTNISDAPQSRQHSFVPHCCRCWHLSVSVHVAWSTVETLLEGLIGYFWFTVSAALLMQSHLWAFCYKLINICCFRLFCFHLCFSTSGKCSTSSTWKQVAAVTVTELTSDMAFSTTDLRFFLVFYTQKPGGNICEETSDDCCNSNFRVSQRSASCWSVSFSLILVWFNNWRHLLNWSWNVQLPWLKPLSISGLKTPRLTLSSFKDSKLKVLFHVWTGLYFGFGFHLNWNWYALVREGSKTVLTWYDLSFSEAWHVPCSIWD